MFRRWMLRAGAKQAVQGGEAVEAVRLTGADAHPLWPQSPQYEAVVSEGHRRPPPSFGAPTLVWHLGIWQGLSLDEHEKTRHDSPANRNASPTEIFERRLKEVVRNIDSRNEQFIAEVCDVLSMLQRRGRPLSSPLHRFNSVTSDLQNESDAGFWPHHFNTCEPQSLAFTLWWQDDAVGGRLNERQDRPSPNDLRIRVQTQTHLEHVTVSFFIDVGKPWNGAPVTRSQDASGVRRRHILQQIEALRAITDRQVRGDQVEFPFSPERLDSPDEARMLLEAADYLYEGVWAEFLQAFGLKWQGGQPTGNLGIEGEVFANFRGLVLSTAGIKTPNGERAKQRLAELRNANLDSAPSAVCPGAEATTGFGTFQRFDNDGGEPNTVLRAYWPFIRRITPDADRRDFLGFGIYEWRTLFVSALGSPVESVIQDEEADDARDAPFGALPKPREVNGKADEPIRYLLLTKGEPHRDQIGRCIERINAVETIRLFALKHWPTIRNAAALVRVLGRELDEVLAHWSKQRIAIETEYRDQLKEALSGSASFFRSPRHYIAARHSRKRPHLNKWEIEHPSIQKIGDARLNALNGLIHETEGQLISLGASLDDVGRGGAGRLLYAVSRSQYFIEEFDRMAPTLEIGNIDGWINYQQFIERGLKPSFDLIRKASAGHTAFRNRLQWVSDMIQTSALIVETGATSRNTEILRKVAVEWRWTKWSVLTLVTAIVVQMAASGALDVIINWLKGLTWFVLR